VSRKVWRSNEAHYKCEVSGGLRLTDDERQLVANTVRDSTTAAARLDVELKSRKLSLPDYYSTIQSIVRSFEGINWFSRLSVITRPN